MYWTTGDGKQVKYCDLAHDHFMNIIADGYRNYNLIEEAKSRGIDVPARAVDSMTEKQLAQTEEDMILKAIGIQGLSEEELNNIKKFAHQNLDRLKSVDYQTYLLYLSRFLDNRDESLRD